MKSNREFQLQSNLLASRRRGAAMILILGMLFVFAIAAAITVDFSYMQLVRTELRVATDSAAKAGAEALARTEDVDLARSEAVRYASMNSVAGQPLAIAESDVILGRLVESGGGRWQFSPGGFPPNAVRVDANTGGDALHPAIPLHFGRILGRSTFTPHSEATAGQQQVEVCLCLDRSGSMLFDMTGVDYEYVPNNPYLSNFTAWGDLWRNHLSAPHPTQSRWAVLRGAVQIFYDEAALYTPAPKTSLVTWASDYTMPISPGTVFKSATLNVGLPQSDSTTFAQQRSLITNAINSLNTKPMMGGTHLSAGVDLAVSHLTGGQSSSFSNKIVILLTDGQWNAGRTPQQVGTDARNAGVVIHAVTMLTNLQNDVRQMAEMTGGRYYSTTNETELRDAFRELARSLPIVIVE